MVMGWGVVRLFVLLSFVQICKAGDLCLQEKVAKVQEAKDTAMSNLTQAIEEEKKEQWRIEGRSMLFDAKRVTSNTFVYILSVFPPDLTVTWDWLVL